MIENRKFVVPLRTAFDLVGRLILTFFFNSILLFPSSLEGTSEPHVEHRLSKGDLCEGLALERLTERYGLSDYAIFRNVQYGLGRVRKMRGELDVVVVHLRGKHTGLVEVVEVKCRKDGVLASKTARQQLDRFKKSLGQYCSGRARQKLIMFFERDVGVPVPCAGFDEVLFHTYGPEGQSGFDFSLGASIQEIDLIHNHSAPRIENGD